MKKIIQIGNKTLREIAKEVPTGDIKTAKIKNIIMDMKEALGEEPDGVGLAAPQIGKLYRIFIISGKILESAGEKDKTQDDLVFINPAITKVSRKKELMSEGCLSIRNKHGKVKRSAKVTVGALDESGKRFERGGSGLLAQILQHEMDHLDGILFVDKAENVSEKKEEDEDVL